MIRLLVQFKSNDVFGGPLEHLGSFNTFNEAVDFAIEIFDDTCENMIVKDGPQAVRLFN